MPLHAYHSLSLSQTSLEPGSPLLASSWMNDSVSLSVSVIDRTPAAAVTSWKDRPSWEQQYSYWSSLWPTGHASTGEWKSRSSHLLSWEPTGFWCVRLCVPVCESLSWWSHRWDVAIWNDMLWSRISCSLKEWWMTRNKKSPLTASSPPPPHHCPSCNTKSKVTWTIYSEWQIQELL